MPRVGWLWAAVASAVVGVCPPAAAQPLGPISPVDAGEGPPPPAEVPPRSQLPPPILGAPVGVPDSNTRSSPISASSPPAAERTPPPERPTERVRAATLGAPRATDSTGTATITSTPVPSAIVDKAIAQTAYQPPVQDPVAEFLNRPSSERHRPVSPQQESTNSSAKWGHWGETMETIFGQRAGGWFRSDHMFDGFISPVTNPFLFEDPRSLTEARPIFIYQKIPSSQPDFLGGNISYFGVQGRLALSDRWSFVFHKLGGIWINPGSASRFDDESSFAELWLGPKWTFYRGEENGILAAAGLQFQLPVGSSRAFQNTGNLSIAPYLSYAQNFLRDFQFGSFNFLANTGFAFATNNERSSYYWLSAHLDFDVMNAHRFYPLVELNWFVVTNTGRSTPIGAEGRDLINFGGQAGGTGLLTGAFGGRVKITESAQLGAAFEIPFAGRRDLFRNRFTVDFILRY